MIGLDFLGIFTVVVVVVILMFMPALIELKKPRDAGPRMIVASLPPIFSIAKLVFPPTLMDIEWEPHIHLADIKLMLSLPNLESAFSE